MLRHAQTHLLKDQHTSSHTHTHRRKHTLVKTHHSKSKRAQFAQGISNTYDTVCAFTTREKNNAQKQEPRYSCHHPGTYDFLAEPHAFQRRDLVGAEQPAGNQHHSEEFSRCLPANVPASMYESKKYIAHSLTSVSKSLKRAGHSHKEPYQTTVTN